MSLCRGLLTRSVVWLLGVHKVESRGDLISLAFTSKDDLALVVCATYRPMNMCSE
jgi:hypothetical protein